MSRYVYIVIVCMACLLMLPLPVSAVDQFDGKYVGKTAVLDMEVPTTMEITNSQIHGTGELNADKDSSGSWSASQSLDKIRVHFDITIDGKVAGNGNVIGTVKGTFSIHADNKMVGVFNNPFSGTIKDDTFTCSPTITIKITECVGMGCKDNQSGSVSIRLLRTWKPTLTPENSSPKAWDSPGPLVDKLPAPPGEEPAGFVKEFNGTVYVSAGPLELPPSQQKWIKVTGKTMLYEGWTVRTAPGSEAMVLYARGILVRTRENSWFDMHTPVMAQTGVIEMHSRLFKGIYNFYMEKRKQEQKKFEVEVDRANTSIQGTNFVLEETDTQTLIKVIEGTVKFTSKVNGQTANVTAGQMITATDSGLKQISTFDAASEKAKWGPMPPPDVDLTNANTSTSTRSNPSTGSIPSPKKPGLSLPKCPLIAALEVDPTSPRLTIFRNFRDKVLARSAVGTAFISIYYWAGTWLADNILSSDLIRFLARQVIVEPLSLALNGSAFIWNN